MIDAELFERYQKALGTNAELVKLEVVKLLESIEKLNPYEAAEFLSATYPKLLKAYGKTAADVARQFYQDTRDSYYEDEDDVSDYVARTAAAIPDRWAQEDIVKASSKGLDILPGRAVRHTMERADATIKTNIRRDPKKARWAVVPHPGACAWCILIAGNGWRYSYESVNAQRHDNCKCSVVADFDQDSPALEGYDPKAMQDAYAKCEETIHDSVDDLWNALSDEKRAKYLKQGGRGKDGFKRDLVLAEMNRRDREWLRTGKAPEIDYSEKSRAQFGVRAHNAKDYLRQNFIVIGNEWKDLFVHDSLQAAGFSIIPHRTIQEGGITNRDISIGNSIWEIKSPEAQPNSYSKDELKFVQRRVQRARHQFRDEGISDVRIVFNNYYTGFYGKDETRVYTRFRDEVAKQGIADALFITKKGIVMRVK
ncbi:MAG: hypothetical protein IJ125_07745 [Atopobiaceae bacterium]|nr:hypothetical protein [Atopobiaceae bacterium]